VSPTIFALAIAFGFFSNHYFGWHWTAQSDAEIVCDGISFVLFALSARSI